MPKLELLLGLRAIGRCFLLLLSSALCSAGTTKFMKVFEEELKKTKTGEICAEIASFQQIVSIRGGLNSEHEQAKIYADNARAFEDAGNEVVISWPDSRESVQKNSEVVLSEIKELLEENPGKDIVLTGHSKGGAELFASFLLHPELFEHPRIKAVVIIQSPIGGSSQASRVFKASGKPYPFYSVLTRLMPGVDPESFMGQGMFSISNNEMEALNAKATQHWRHQDVDHQKLLEKLLVVRSQEKNRLKWPIELLLGVHPPSYVGDGVSKFQDQAPNQLIDLAREDGLGGIDVVDLPGHHFSLVGVGARACSTLQYRRAFSTALLRYLEERAAP